MSRWLRTLRRSAALLALSAAAVGSAQGQELNFRAVVRRPAADASPIPVSITVPGTITPVTFVARAKAGDEPAPLAVTQPDLRPMPLKDAVRPLPGGEFVPPPPSMVMPPGSVVAPGAPLPPGAIVVHPGTSPHVVSSFGADNCCAEPSFGGGACCDGVLGNWRPLHRILDCLSPGCIDTCDPCCLPRRQHFWLRGEYLLWNTNGTSIPPLVTQSANGTRTGLPIGAAGSSVLYDERNLPSDFYHGGRFTMGFWFPRHNDWGLDVSYLFLGERTNSTTISSLGVPGLGRPFFNVDPTNPRTVNTEQAEIVSEIANGNLRPGSVTIDTKTRIWTLDANLRRKLCCGPRYWVDGLVGYRHFNLRDNFAITEDLKNIPPDNDIDGPGAADFIVRDRFSTQNTFNGGQIGLEGECRLFPNLFPRWSIGWTTKLAVGNVTQVIVIDGSTTRTLYADRIPITQPGGLLAQPSNIGRYERNKIAVMPEFGIKLNFDLTDHLRLYAGYNILYLSDVVRAGDQIDRRVNRTQNAFAGPNGTQGVLNGPALPAVLFKSSDFWANGANFGLEWHY